MQPVREHARLRLIAVGVVWLALALWGATLVHRAEVEQRDTLERLYTARAETTAQFLELYAQDIFNRELVLAREALRGKIEQADFDRINRRNGIEASVVLDTRGRVLASYPASPALMGTDLSSYPHLAGAKSGVPTASNVVLSAVRKVPVVAFAIPFDSPGGRRVLSAAYDIERSPLSAYLDDDAGQVPDANYLVDADGAIASSGGPLAVRAQRLEAVDPGLDAAATAPGARTVEVAGAPWRVVTVELQGTPWRLVHAAPAGLLYASISAADVWTPRLVLLALALGLLVVIALLERLARQRSRLHEQQVESAAVLEGTADAFVGADPEGRIIAWNPAAQTLFGWSRRDAVGRPFAELLSGGDTTISTPGTATPDLLSDAGQADGPRSDGPASVAPVELTARRSNGQELPVELSLVTTRLPAGERRYAFFRDIRPRRLAEERTKVLAQVAESAGDAIYSRDLDGRLLSWNPSAVRLFGWTEAESLGQGLDHAMVGDGAKEMAAMIRAVASTRAVQYCDTIRYNRSGQPIDLRLTVAPLLGANGVLVGVSVIARDIGERSRLEEQLRRSEGVFRSAFDDALLGMCLTGPEGRLLRVNPVFAGMVGRAAEDLVGTLLDDVTDPEHRGQDASRQAQALAGVIDSYRAETCYLTVDGVRVWAEISVSLVRDAAAAPLHFVTQVVDVTARRAALRERDSRDAMLAAVIANSQSLIYVLDLDGRYLLANAPFSDAFGVTEDFLLGRDDVFLQPSAMPAWQAGREAAGDGAYQLEQWSDGPDGRHYYESVTFGLHDAGGRLYGMCAVCLDVTEQRRAVTALALARDEALAATAAKSAFLATMSHEIRTPMNAVIGMTGLLLDSNLDRQQREFAETVRNSGDALLGVINDILDFSKIESGQLQLEQRPFDLTEAVEGSVDLVAVAAAGKGLDLVCYVEPSCPVAVVGDHTRLRQVLVNLLSNAVKFTSTGDVLLTVTAGPLATDLHQLTFTVTDTGIGIPAGGMDRLFRSFSQVDDSTTRVYGGTGLGLAISRRLVEAMGGELRVTSTVGVGSSFAFSLVLPDAQEGSQAALRRAAAARSTAALAGQHVLVVDDNATNLRILSLQLSGYGMACTAVTTPSAALDLTAAGHAYDLAVLDMHLPDMDGLELAARLRELPAARDVPLVLLTSLGDMPKGGRSLFAQLLTKPVKSVALRQALTEALSPPAAGDLPRRPELGRAPATPDRRLRVLLVEDNATNQKVAQLMLKRLGHPVDTVGNGEEAVQAAGSVPYDVILMDVQMPVMDGLVATRRIRSMQRPGSQPYILAMTASVLVEDRTACIAAGMDGHLPKPVRAAELSSFLDLVQPVGSG